MLHDKGRLSLLRDIEDWRASLLNGGLIEIPVDGAIGSKANTFTSFHADPADRLIVATAMQGHQLVTEDRLIFGVARPATPPASHGVNDVIDRILIENPRHLESVKPGA